MTDEGRWLEGGSEADYLEGRTEPHECAGSLFCAACGRVIDRDALRRVADRMQPRPRPNASEREEMLTHEIRRAPRLAENAGRFLSA